MATPNHLQQNPPNLGTSSAGNQSAPAPTVPSVTPISPDSEFLGDVIKLLIGAYLTWLFALLGWLGGTLFFLITVIVLVAYRLFSSYRKTYAQSLKQLIKGMLLLIRRNLLQLLVLLLFFIAALVITPPIVNAIGILLNGSPVYELSSAFKPTEYMGDIGDLGDPVNKPDYITFTYRTNGAGPCVSDFSSGKDTNIRCRFAGVMFLSSSGDTPGVDLTRYRKRITWEARLNPASTDATADVEFVIGGATWRWDEQSRRVDVDYPDSIPQRSLGIEELNHDWQTFDYPFTDFTELDFKNVAAGFGWVIAWGSNGVQLNAAGTGSEHAKTFVIDIRNIQYEG